MQFSSSVSLSWLWVTTFTPVPWAHTPGSAVEWLWGTQPFKCCIMWVAQGHGKQKKPLKRVIFTRIHSVLSKAAEMTYKQTADAVPDGGKILWHIERLLLPKIHSLLSRIQPFHQFLWVSVVATGETKHRNTFLAEAGIHFSPKLSSLWEDTCYSGTSAAAQPCRSTASAVIY